VPPFQAGLSKKRLPPPARRRPSEIPANIPAKPTGSGRAGREDHEDAKIGIEEAKLYNNDYWLVKEIFALRADWLFGKEALEGIVRSIFIP